MTIVNSASVLENQFPFIKKSHVIIEYGTPVLIQDLPKEQQKRPGAYFQTIIQETHIKNIQNL